MNKFLDKIGLLEFLNSLTAKWIKYDNTASGLSSTTVQGAVDEVNKQISSVALNSSYRKVLYVNGTDTFSFSFLGELETTSRVTLTIKGQGSGLPISTTLFLRGTSTEPTYVINDSGCSVVSLECSDRKDVTITLPTRSWDCFLVDSTWPLE